MPIEFKPLGLVLLLGTTLAHASLFSKEKLSTGITAASLKDVTQQVTVAGNIFPNRRTVISPPYNAYIKKLYVNVGDLVKAGDPIVALTQSLRELGEPSYPLRAPFPGKVVQVSKSEGEYVEQNKDGNSIVRIDDTSRLFVRTEVPESDIAKIKLKQDVIIKVNGILERQYHGSVQRISLAAKEKGGWGRTGERVDFDVELEILDKDEKVLPGMSTIIDIIIAKKTKVLTLPQEYIQKDKEGFSVTRENGKKQKVEIGLKNDQLFEITAGLKEQDRIKIVDFLSLPEQE